LVAVRLLIARCQVDYAGRLTAHLPMATRLIMVKADGSVSVHADDRAYKPLNWMSAPCTLAVLPPSDEVELAEVWEVRNGEGDTLQISIGEVFHDSSHEHPTTFGAGWTLVTREHLTPIGPVDLLYRDADGGYVAVEVKRRGEIDGVEQLTRYLALMNADPRLAPVRGVFAAQQIKPQARVLAGTRGIECVLVDYDLLRGLDNVEDRLF
jgi:RecB family endonuclease NucS